MTAQIDTPALINFRFDIRDYRENKQKKKRE
jgi:hypothetical protein